MQQSEEVSRTARPPHVSWHRWSGCGAGASLSDLRERSAVGRSARPAKGYARAAGTNTGSGRSRSGGACVMLDQETLFQEGLVRRVHQAPGHASRFRMHCATARSNKDVMCHAVSLPDKALGGRPPCEADAPCD